MMLKYQVTEFKKKKKNLKGRKRQRKRERKRERERERVIEREIERARKRDAQMKSQNPKKVSDVGRSRRIYASFVKTSYRPILP